MNRRQFLGAFGGASGAALAGCTETELDFSRDGTPYENPEERIRFLERQRAVLLYAGGATLVAAGERAFPDLKTAVFKSPYTYAELSVYRGRAAGYYDAAAWNFARAGVVLSNLGDLDATIGVEACATARAKAFHLGMGSSYRARAILEAKFGGAEKETPTSVLEYDGGTEETATDDGGMQPMGTEADDDGGMQPMGTPVDDGTEITGDTPQELADAHFARANELDVVPVKQLRDALGLTG